MFMFHWMRSSNVHDGIVHFELLHGFAYVFLLFQTFPTPTSHSKMVYSSPNLKTSMKPGAGSKPHDVQEALKKKQVLSYLLAD